MLENSLVKDDDTVVLYFERDKYFLIKVKRGGSFSFNKGKVDFDNIIGKQYGSYVYTNMGIKLFIFKPTIVDRIMKIKRKTQIIYPKDAGFLLLKMALTNGSRVIEMGCGSGAMTIALANVIKKEGMVYSYDYREEFLELAEKNLKEAALDEFVELKLLSAGNDFFEKDVDAVMLDLPSPWEGLKPSWNALKGGGVIACISPTFNQVEKTVEEMRNVGFEFIECSEILYRIILARTGKTRPFERMIGHTGFLIFGRKVLLE